ncbi:MAG: leucyl/phenylalanyl-tRNA--protein transferase, partial [Deltaproteobacteria bacterium]|nr:leucyl/phenylalanyl-tRNA--protein transferase [Deltaproteobacteria bacterium]
LLAYSKGIFPWPSSSGSLIPWFSPDPRFVLRPESTHLSRSLRKEMRKKRFEIRFDTDFESVVRNCATVPRPRQRGTWMTSSLVEGMIKLHQEGYAHSAEAYLDGKLVGGLYGVSIGSYFSGESMFALEPNASKVAFVTLIAHFIRWGIGLVDCQVYTDHLARFGAYNMRRKEFLEELRIRVVHPTKLGPWQVEFQPDEALMVWKENAKPLEKPLEEESESDES